MKVSTNLKNWSTRAKNGIAAALFFVAYASSAAVPFMVARSAHAQSYDTGWKIPTVAQSPAGWTNSAATTVQADDNNYTTNNTGATQGYGSFNFGIPNGAQINGIAVSTNAKSTDSSGCRLSVRLSWDGGVSTTSSQNANLTGTETNYILGDATDTWGRTWTPAELNNPAFLSLLQDNDPGRGCTNDAITSVDTLSVRVY